MWVSELSDFNFKLNYRPDKTVRTVIIYLDISLKMILATLLKKAP